MADQDTRTGLAALSELPDYRVASGNPDIRGWTVFSSDGKEIGRVRDLVVEVDALKVRYMVVGLKHGLFGKKHEVVLPIGRARLDDTSDNVYVQDVSSAGIDTLHEYDPTTFRTQERAVFGGDYSSVDYDDARFWGARRVVKPDDRYLERQGTGDVSGDTGFGEGGLRKKEPV